jgi:hypothetical protein
MTCECICSCQNIANDTAEPRLCMACSLCDALGGSQHGLPYVAPKFVKLEPSVPISDAMKDQAIDAAVSELGL